MSTATLTPDAMVWLPREGQVIAKIPPAKGNKRWLRGTVNVRSPRLDGDRWQLPRNCLLKFITAAVDRYGYVAVHRDMSKLSRCTRMCLEAMGAECDCSCLGAHHGEADSGSWFERSGDVMVTDYGEFSRTTVIYGPKGADGDAQIYHGELEGRRYRADRPGRRDWPRAGSFMCPSCATAQAEVWDHCHTHGFVRAPLCTRCNTRHWRGWSPAHGRATASRNVDTTYYRWCPEYGDGSQTCSA